MAINNTGAMFKSFEFDGTDSRNFGVYITGAAVYNAPEREVEMISIPNRNGAFALDKGRFENIEVTYPAGIYADNESDFAEGISDLRNFLCSKRGYCRLTDEYNPNEYRMAIYKSGLEVEPALLRAGEFEITFECMPQRYLTSGETEITVLNGQTITNPTLFDANPLLQVEGYGTINFNGFDIELFDDLVGTVIPEGYVNTYLPYASNIGGIYVNANDAIQYQNQVPVVSFLVDVTDGYPVTISNCVQSNVSYSGVTSPQAGVSQQPSGEWLWNCQFTGLNYSALVPKDAYISCTLTFTDSNSNSTSINITARAKYDGKSKIEYSLSGINLPPQYKLIASPRISFDTLKIVSTATTYGHPTYIDCSSGEAFAVENNTLLSLNRYIDIGTKLPRLTAGSNTITYDNTITQLKMKPRWWKV